jgi:serine/threonine-protein kinase
MINDILGQLIADKYRVESLIRESETGDLYHGRHEVLDKPVTLKILSPAHAVDGRWVKKFIDEARSASTLSHPNILSLTDFGTDVHGVSYVVYEQAEDSTLDELLAVESQLEPGRAMEISRLIAGALSAAHAKGLVHARLDPKNVFVGTVDEVDTVKVFGFGGNSLEVARDADPRYLAPEQCNSFSVANERSDVYTLGIMLYQMLTGEVPYDGSTFGEVLARQAAGPPTPLADMNPDLHAEIEPPVMTAIALDPDKRYQTMDAFAEDLDKLAARLGGKGKAKAAGASGRNVWQTAFVVVAGICVLAVALIYATSNKKTDPTTQLQAADTGSLPVQPIGPATGAQEESLARLPAMTDAEIMATSAMQQSADAVPGGDGFNAWANGGVPPPGAPLQPYVPPGGQVYTIDPNGGSQFMPNDTGVVLVPVPVNPPEADPKASPGPKTPASNTAVQPGPVQANTPKPMATPPPKNRPGTTQPPKGKAPAAENKPTTRGEPKDS